MSHRLVFGAIADDLTGGIELASMLVARGVKTGFAIGAGARLRADAEAQVIALKSRVVPAADAVAQVLEAADRLIAAGTRQLFFKYCATFDSTPRGNIGPCAEALLDKLGAPQTLFVPALCETGRTVYQGHMFGGSQLLGESPKRFDPLTPMTDSNLVRVLQAQSRMNAGLLPFAAVDAGPTAIDAQLAKLVADGVALVIADTLAERHLAHLAAAAVDAPLLTGNSSVAAHLPPLWRAKGLIGPASPITLPGVHGPGAVLAGSVAEKTLMQLEDFAAGAPVLTLDIARAFAGEDLVAEALSFAREHFAAGRDIAISTAVPQTEVERLQATYGRAEAAACAEGLHTAIARRLVEELGLARLIVAGGETSGAVMAGLGVDEIVVGPYLGLGMNRGLVQLQRPLAVVLKSGKLGPRDVFRSMLSAMGRPLMAEPALDAWPPAR